jgi:hypothetical protein
MRSTDIAAALLLWTSIGVCQTLTTDQARAHDYEIATVCGTVVNQHVAVDSQGKPTFIDLDAAFPTPAFAILVWDEDRQNVGALPRSGTHVCVSGQINYYHGVPQIVVRSSAQFRK